MLRFLGARMLRGVEWVRGAEYLRTARMGDSCGWLHVHNAPRQRMLVIELSASLAPAAPTLLPILRQLFDLSAQPNVIAERLMRGVLAREMVSGGLTLGLGVDPEDAMRRLLALPGIGRWTAEYIAMRALRCPDACPYGDLAVRNSLGGVTATRAEEIAEAWRPWRSYATLHLWRERV